LTVRDQGFRAYTGTRLPPSNNTWVLFRHGVSRATKSWIVRMAFVAAVFPLLVSLVAWAFMGFIAAQNPGQLQPPDLVRFVRDLMRAEMWLAAAAIAFGAGATAISDDVARHALPFFFSKPVSSAQYLVGRTGAIFALILSVLWLPVLVFTPLAVALAAAGALVIAATLSSVSIGVSALASSRALTTSLFASLWLLPHVLASLASVFAEGAWPYLVSLPAQLTFVLESLLDKSQDQSGPTAVHALPLIIASTFLAYQIARRRLERARGAT